MGAAHVIVVEPNPYRRAQAEKIGALAMPPGDEVVERCRELTGRRGGFDVAFECSGAQAALPSAVRGPAPRSNTYEAERRPGAGDRRRRDRRP